MTKTFDSLLLELKNAKAVYRTFEDQLALAKNNELAGRSEIVRIERELEELIQDARKATDAH